MNDCYCKNRDILISKKEYWNCLRCINCSTHEIVFSYDNRPLLDKRMNQLVTEYKQRLRVKKLERII